MAPPNWLYLIAVAFVTIVGVTVGWFLSTDEERGGTAIAVVLLFVGYHFAEKKLLPPMNEGWNLPTVAWTGQFSSTVLLSIVVTIVILNWSFRRNGGANNVPGATPDQRPPAAPTSPSGAPQH
jgi:uncharacterized membrane protein YfcA